MFTIVIFNIYEVFFAHLARHKSYNYFLKGSFFLIFLFLALRYNYGNDYSAYLENFIEINQEAKINYFDGNIDSELGWIFLCRLFGPLGFFVMIAVLALFSCVVFYRFIKKYVPPDYYWLAVFLYVFNPGLMLLHSSAMRQSIVINLFIISLDYIFKKDALRYFLCIAFAALFHFSALILFPVYLLGLFNWKINKTMAVIIFSLFLFMFVFSNSFLSEFNNFIKIYFEKYQVYEGELEIENGTGLGLILNSTLFALILFYAGSQVAEVSLLFKIIILSYLIIPLSLSFSMISRVGMYFQPATIVVLPIILSNIKGYYFRNIVLTMLLFITLYTFYDFFRLDVFSKTYGTYNTIFSAPEVY